MISSREELIKWFDRARLANESGICVVDTEADSLHRYQEKLCLIQYADRHGALLIDPLALEDLALFSTWLSESKVWLHGADYDMCLFNQTFGVLPKMIYDTQIAARLVGFRQFGFAHLVEHFFQVKLSKSAQKEDWARRPLPPGMQTYALNDVVYLFPLVKKLSALLRKKNRWEWFLESCAHAMQQFLQRKEETSNEEAWRVRGSGKFSPSELRYLKALWTWRNNEARLVDRPTFFVLSNQTLLDWALVLGSGGELPLEGRKIFRPRLNNLLACVEKAKRSPESFWPERIRREHKQRDSDFVKKFEALQKKRDAVAEELDIDSTFLASRSVLEAIVDDKATGMELLLNWQRRVLKF